MATLNLNSLISSVMGSNNAAQADLSRNTNAATDILEGVRTRALEVAEATRLSKETAGLAEVKAQQQSLELATRLGTNPEAANFVLSQYIDQKNATFAQARAMQQQINQKNSTTLADPLAWLGAQLTVNNDIAQYNALADDYNLVGRQIDDLVSMTGAMDQMTAQIAQTRTNESVKADATIAAATALDLADKAALDALATNSDGLMKVHGLREGQLNTAFRVRDQQMQEASHALAQQNAKIQSQRLALEMAKEKKEQNAEQLTLQAWNTARATMGLPPATQEILGLAYRADQDGTMLEINNGLKTMQIKAQSPGIDARFLGSTPAEALSLVRKYNVQLDPGRGRLMEFVGNTEAALAKNANNAANMAQPNKAAQLINHSVIQEAAKAHENAQGSENIYAPPSLTTLMADPTIASTPSGQIVLKPLAESGAKTFDANIVIPQIMEQVAKGKIPMSQAITDIEFIANKAIMYNNNYYSYRGTLGIPDQTALNMTLEMPSLYRDTLRAAARHGSVIPGLGYFMEDAIISRKRAVIDLSDKAQIQDYANKYMVSKLKPQLVDKAINQNQK